MDLLALQFCDDYTNDRGEVQVCKVSPNFMFGMWFNTAKNPRFRHIDMADIQTTIEISKQIALASVALLVHVCRTQE